MLRGYVSESHHLYQQAASAQVNDTNRQQLSYFGYLSSYNAQTGYGTVLNPENCDDNGVPIITGPIPIITAWIGIANGQNPITGEDDEPWGIQICPFGGATAQNLNGGEQVLVIHARPEIGYGATGFLLPNNNALPPGGDQIPIIQRQIQPGEMLIVSPAQSLILLDAQGTIHIYTQQVNDQGGHIKIGVQGGVRIETTENDTAVADPNDGDINVQALQNLFLQSQQGNLTARADRGNIEIAALTQDILEGAYRNINRGATTGYIHDQAEGELTRISLGANIADVAAGNLARFTAAGNITDDCGNNYTLTAGALIDRICTAGNIVDIAGANMARTAAAGSIADTAGLSINLTAGGLISLDCPIINAGIPALLYLPLLTQFFLTLYNSHTHGVSGASTTPPVISALPVYPNVTKSLYAN